MKFKLKNQAYTHAIYELNQASRDLEDRSLVDQCINQIKVAIENHEQDPGVVSQYILDLLRQVKFSSDNLSRLTSMAKDIEKNKYTKDSQTKFENPLARRAESEIAIEMLQNPTREMMKVVDIISVQIIKLLLKNIESPLLKTFLDNLTCSSHPIGFGGFKDRPIVREVVDILSNGRDPKLLIKIVDPTKISSNPSDLTEIENIPQKKEEKSNIDLAAIMHLHFKFAYSFLRVNPITVAPHRKPTGKLKTLIEGVWPNKDKLENYFTIGIAQRQDPFHLRSFISDDKFCGSPLYTQERGKGREGKQNIDERYQNQGLMLLNQQQYEKDLPLHTSDWAPDCKTQAANLQSMYVRDLIENDAVYVAGPSGMTSLLLSQMEMLGNFEDEKTKKNYLSVVAFFMAAGGYHSLHEVIGPAQYVLDLVPGYRIHAPFSQTAKPPNYNVFFQQQSLIDPEFAPRRDKAWEKYLQFYERVFLPRNDPEEVSDRKKTETKKYMFNQAEPKPGPDPLEKLYTLFVEELNKYIRSRSNPEGELNFIARTLMDEGTTTLKVQLARQLIRDARSAFENGKLSVDVIKSILSYGRVLNKELDSEKTKVNFLDKGLGGHFDKIDSFIQDFERQPQYKSSRP